MNSLPQIMETENWAPCIPNSHSHTLSPPSCTDFEIVFHSSHQIFNASYRVFFFPEIHCTLFCGVKVMFICEKNICFIAFQLFKSCGSYFHFGICCTLFCGDGVILWKKILFSLHSNFSNHLVSVFALESVVLSFVVIKCPPICEKINVLMHFKLSSHSNSHFLII